MACRAQRTAKSIQTNCIRLNTTRSPRVSCMFPTCFHVFTTCLPRVHHVFTTCLPRVHHVFTPCSPRVHSVFTTCSPRVHHVFTTCSPHVHHVFTTCSPRVLYVSFGLVNQVTERDEGVVDRDHFFRLAARSTSIPMRPNNLMYNCARMIHRQPTNTNLADH